MDRMACAWLITKYIDPDAEILFVPVGQRPLPEGAEPFDIPGVRLSHHRGHCTFYTMLREYDLKDSVLHRIAHIVDEADVVQEVPLYISIIIPKEISFTASSTLSNEIFIAYVMSVPSFVRL